MNRKKLFPLVFLAIVVVASLTACHTTRNATSSPEAESDWQNLYTSVNVSLEQPMSMSFSGKMTMVRDSCILVSMRFIGMEVAALYMNRDSVYFADKYHKYLFAEPLADILGQKYNNLTIGDIQQIVLGQRKVPNSPTVKIKPSGYANTVAGYVAGKLELNVEAPQGDLKGSTEWNPDNAQWNDASRKATFKVPTNYRRVTLDQVRTIFKSMNF